MRVHRTVRVIALAGALGAALVTGTTATASAAAAATCSDFTYQEQAQAALAANPDLDRNHNGIACESLPHRPVTSPTPTATPTPTPTPSATASAAPTTTATATATSAATTTTTRAASTTTPASTTAADDRNCSDFATQAAAQAVLTADPTDPNRLDANHNGVACEDAFGTTAQQVAVFPNGPVHTGGSPRR